MKRLTVIIAFFALISVDTFAQQNVVKLGIFGLTYGRANLSYERVIGDNKTIHLTAGYQIPRGFPIDPSEFDDTGDFRVNSAHWKSAGISPSFRIYPASRKETPRGFYFGPFVNYNTNSLKFKSEYDLPEEDRFDIPSDLVAKQSGIGLGLNLGTQWIINDRVSIDWNYFGIGISHQAYKMTFTSSDPLINYEDLEDEFENDIEVDSGFPGSPVTVNADANGIKAKFRSFSPVFKTSLSIGYAF